MGQRSRQKNYPHELELVLPGEEHHLPVQNAFVQLEPHGNAGVAKLFQNLCITNVRGTRIEEYELARRRCAY